jgi:hypothetical protein
LRLRRAGEFVLVLAAGRDEHRDVWLWSRDEYEAASRSIAGAVVDWGHDRPPAFARLPALSWREAWEAYRRTAPIEIPESPDQPIDLSQVLPLEGYDPIRTAWRAAVRAAPRRLTVAPLIFEHEVLVVHVDSPGQPPWTMLARGAPSYCGSRRLVNAGIGGT